MIKFALFLFINVFALQGIHAQAPVYNIFAIRFAESGYPFTVADWVAGGPKNMPLDINFSVWLIKGEGKKILVDAGFLKDIEDAKDFKITSYTRPDSALLRAGVNAAEITDIIITHPHWDHIDGLGLFPNAKVWIQKGDYKFFTETAWQEGQQNGGFAKRDVAMLTKMYKAGRVKLVDGDNKEIIPGIRVYTGSKHTSESQFVVVSAPKSEVVIASDNVWTYFSIEHMLPPALGGTLDPKAYLESMKRMKTLATSNRLIIPGHDADVYKRFKSIGSGIAEIK